MKRWWHGRDLRLPGLLLAAALVYVVPKAFTVVHRYGWPEDFVDFTIRFDTQHCRADHPILIEVTNNSRKQVDSITYRPIARRPGHSDNLMPHIWDRDDDTVILPGSKHGTCWIAPEGADASWTYGFDTELWGKGITFHK